MRTLSTIEHSARDGDLISCTAHQLFSLRTRVEETIAAAAAL